jgi:hypothetical protein
MAINNVAVSDNLPRKSLSRKINQQRKATVCLRHTIHNLDVSNKLNEKDN